MSNRPRPHPIATLAPLCVALSLSVGCGDRGAKDTLAADLNRPLSQLADEGQIEALQVLADLEVLRAQGVFEDSTADRLMARSAATFLTNEAHGKLARGPWGQALTTLLAHGEWSEAERVTLRRRAGQDPLAAAAWADSAARAHVTRQP